MKKDKQIGQVAIFGMLGNIILLSSKLTIGFISGSHAMIADGMNSAGDVFASAMTFIGNRISNQPGDSNHPYGHGKAEYIFSMIISFSLLLVAFTIFRSSFDALINGSKFTYSIWLVIIAIMTIIIKFFLYIHAKRISILHNSLLAQANAIDHRNDIFVTSMTLLSILTGYYDIYLVDGIVGMILAFIIAYSGIGIFSNAYSVLMDTTVPQNIHDAFAALVQDIAGVDHIDAITAKPLGANFLLLVKVSVDANLTVFESHNICDKIKETLMKSQNVDDVIVHVNPAQFHR
ncbi:MAG: cation diffusion facilitator family transporter [Vallitaleaceae bacterium]|jgi:cation diffusion facilitator family transporter|nr:cation diffusion facilitator family transporter [Vallitaleaceae bacterium]